MIQTDKDNPKTWKIFRAKHCENCMAHCCSMPVEIQLEDLVRLELTTQEEAEGSFKKLVTRLKKEKWIRSYRDATGLFTLEQTPQGDCIFLDVNRKCKVYEKRPITCRRFPAEIGRRVGYCPSLPKPSKA
jgi:Fe-S-cluster containining protein